MSRAHRLARLLTIVSHVINSPGQTPAELADAVGISERTLFRDLTALRKLGFEVGYQDGYQIQESLDLVWLRKLVRSSGGWRCGSIIFEN